MNRRDFLKCGAGAITGYALRDLLPYPVQSQDDSKLIENPYLRETFQYLQITKEIYLSHPFPGLEMTKNV